MKVYKIRNKITGLYSRGGNPPAWGKTGKTWNAIGHLKNHLNQFTHVYFGHKKDITPEIYADCEVIIYDLETKIIETERKDVC